MRFARYFLRPIDLRPALFVGVTLLFSAIPHLAQAQDQPFVETDTELQFHLNNPELGVNNQILEMWRRATPDGQSKVTLTMVETQGDLGENDIKSFIARLRLKHGNDVHILYSDLSEERTPQDFRQMEKLFNQDPNIRELPEPDQDQLRAATREYRVEKGSKIARYNNKLTAIKLVTMGGVFIMLSVMGRHLPTEAHFLAAFWMATISAQNQITLFAFNRIVFALPDWTFQKLDKLQGPFNENLNWARGKILNIFGIEDTFEKWGIHIPWKEFSVDLASRNLEKYPLLKTFPKKLFTFLLVFPYLIVNYGVTKVGDFAVLKYFRPAEYGHFDLHAVATATLVAWFTYILSASVDFFAEGIPHLGIANRGARLDLPLEGRLKYVASRSMCLSIVVTTLAAAAGILKIPSIALFAWPAGILGFGYYVFDNYLPKSEILKKIRDGTAKAVETTVRNPITQEKIKRRLGLIPGTEGERRVHCIALLQKAPE